MRCVFDTHVLISALLLPDSKSRQALDLAHRKGSVLISFATLAELSEVLSRKKFLRYVDEGNIRSFLAALTREAEWVEVYGQIVACRDPKDDKILELAVSGNATHIVTGDSDLIALNPFRGIEILAPHRSYDRDPSRKDKDLPFKNQRREKVGCLRKAGIEDNAEAQSYKRLRGDEAGQR